MKAEQPNPDWHPHQPDALLDPWLKPGRRLMVMGGPGSGKSTLSAALGRALAERGRPCQCLCADLGSPAFGAPGTVSLGVWRDDGWRRETYEALCTLDAGRFRLPLVQAVRRLARRAEDWPLILDPPGLVRGVAGAELLPALVEAAAVDAVLMLGDEHAAPLASQWPALSCPVLPVRAAEAAHRRSALARRAERSRRWDAELAHARPARLDLDDLTLLGTPPPVTVPQAWRGRQVALLRDGVTVALGEAIELSGSRLAVRLDRPGEGDALLVRNAVRRADGQLRTADPPAGQPRRADPLTRPASVGLPGATTRFQTGPVGASLVNGLFGDALLELRLNERRRRLLFDLGDPGQLPSRVAHQVSDVFISHAHIDHIGGFPWLMRSRILPMPACRLYGPPGLARHIEHWIGGVRWDRAGENAPVFQVTELHPEPGQDWLHRFHIRAGEPMATLESRPLGDGVLLDESGFCVRAIALDHGIPVLAFAFESADRFNVSREGLNRLGLPGGPWLGDLKQAAANGDHARVIRLPDGATRPAGALIDPLLRRTPGKRLVYATDLADTAVNRERLIDLARGADTLVCEAPFLDRDIEQARRTGHLTARACGEIAAAAGVRQLIPFHFSRRYQGNPEPVYREIEAGRKKPGTGPG